MKNGEELSIDFQKRALRMYLLNILFDYFQDKESMRGKSNSGKNYGKI